MTEELLIALLKDIQQENIRFGSCDVSFCFRDGKVQYYTLTATKKRIFNGTRKEFMLTGGNKNHE